MLLNIGGSGPVAVGAVSLPHGFEAAIALLALLCLIDLVALWLPNPDRRGAGLT